MQHNDQHAVPVSERNQHNSSVARSAIGITVNKLDLTLGSQCLFTDFNINLPAGLWSCILGQSGAGKTSLLRLIAGLLKPDKGSITSSDGSDLQGQITYMSQDDGLLPWLSVIDNIQLGHRLRGTRSDGTYQKALGLLQRLQLDTRASDLPATLSGGMRQRVALLRTLMEDKPVVLMDEPFSRLDAITRVELQDIAVELLQHRTVVLVTHDPLEAARLGHQLIVLSQHDPSKPTILQPDSASPRAVDDEQTLLWQQRIWQAL